MTYGSNWLLSRMELLHNVQNLLIQPEVLGRPLQTYSCC